MKIFERKIYDVVSVYTGHLFTETFSQKYFLSLKIGKPKLLKADNKEIIYESITRTDKFGNPFVLKIEDRVLCKSDRDVSYHIGTIIRFTTLNGKFHDESKATPIIKYDNDDKEYTSFEVVVPYNIELENILKTLRPIEQWNFLCRNHCQVEERADIDYQTFERDSNSAILQYYKLNAKQYAIS